jgi:hypothetical protein
MVHVVRVYVPRMADQPVWRQGFDAVEHELSPRLEAVVRSEEFAVAVGLAARVQRTIEGELSRATRRILHRLNLPAGSDVLRLQIRDLQADLDEARAELARRAAAEAAPPPRRPAAGRKATGG